MHETASVHDQKYVPGLPNTPCQEQMSEKYFPARTRDIRLVKSTMDESWDIYLLSEFAVVEVTTELSIMEWPK